MPTTKRTSFEGQVSGTVATTATTGGGNAGSGDALSQVNTGTGTTTTHDNTHAAHGSNGLRIATGVTSAAANFAQSLPPTDIAFCSTYMYLTSYNGGVTGSNAIRFRGLSVQAARTRFTSTGFVGITDTTTANAVTMTGTAAPLNQLFRLDVQVRVSTGASQAWLYVAHPDALPGLGLHDDTVSTSGALYGSNPIDEVGGGQLTALANVPDTWWDDFAVSDYAMPGPDPGPQIDPSRIPPWLLLEIAAQRARWYDLAAAAVQAGTGAGNALARPGTSATGIKGGTGTASAAARTSTTAAGTKTGTGSATAAARPSTTTTGKPGKSGAGNALARPGSATAGKPGKTGSAAALSRPSTTGAGSKGGAGGGMSLSRTSTGATGSAAAQPPPVLVAVDGSAYGQAVDGATRTPALDGAATAAGDLAAATVGQGYDGRTTTSGNLG